MNFLPAMSMAYRKTQIKFSILDCFYHEVLRLYITSVEDHCTERFRFCLQKKYLYSLAEQLNLYPKKQKGKRAPSNNSSESTLESKRMNSACTTRLKMKKATLLPCMKVNGNGRPSQNSDVIRESTIQHSYIIIFWS